jgi:hypothetical protein
MTRTSRQARYTPFTLGARCLQLVTRREAAYDRYAKRKSSKGVRSSSLNNHQRFFSSLRSLLPSFTSIMRLLLFSTFLYLLSSIHPSSAAESKPWKPCTVRSPTTDRFFDLNPIHRKPAEEGKKKKEGEEGSWHAKGHDYGANFTINFCGPVVEELDHVVDLDKDVWKNVSAFYELEDKVYAIG